MNDNKNDSLFSENSSNFFYKGSFKVEAFEIQLLNIRSLKKARSSTDSVVVHLRRVFVLTGCVLYTFLCLVYMGGGGGREEGRGGGVISKLDI